MQGVNTATVSPPHPVTTAQQQAERASLSRLPDTSVQSRLNSWINGLDWFAVGLVALMSLALHVRFVAHVGGLWRDEANSVQLATLPHLSEVWHCLDFDSFPLLFFVLLRTWLGVFGFHNETALRLLGLLTGIGVMAALWFTVRAFGAKRPVLSFALIGLNPMLIRYGDSTRAYGLGILLMILAFGSFWRLVNSPSPPKWTKVATAALLAVLSTQCLYYNAVLLFAIIVAAVVVCIRKRAWQTAMIALTIGGVAAGCLLPYLPTMLRMREWTFLVSYSIDLAWLWRRCIEVLGAPDELGILVWVGLFALTVSSGLAITRWPHRAVDPPEPFGRPPLASEPVLFAVISVSVAVPAYALFLQILHYYTQPWYYISLVAFAACAIDAALGALAGLTTVYPLMVLRGLRPVVAIALLSLTALPDWTEITTRQTNLDLLARRLTALTKPGDVVLVCEWENAISLTYHYRGPAEIVTVPDIGEHRFHRYDLVLQQMRTEDPVQTIRARLEKSLRAGYSVFIAGSLVNAPASLNLYKEPLSLSERNSTESRKYYRLWQLQAFRFLQEHCSEVWPIPIGVPGNARVQAYENVQLSVFSGWH
jgi:hypothetical protein